jgi:hypothetical protein
MFSVAAQVLHDTPTLLGARQVYLRAPPLLRPIVSVPIAHACAPPVDLDPDGVPPLLEE